MVMHKEPVFTLEMKTPQVTTKPPAEFHQVEEDHKTVNAEQDEDKPEEPTNPESLDSSVEASDNIKYVDLVENQKYKPEVQNTTINEDDDESEEDIASAAGDIYFPKLDESLILIGRPFRVNDDSDTISGPDLVTESSLKDFSDAPKPDIHKLKPNGHSRPFKNPYAATTLRPGYHTYESATRNPHDVINTGIGHIISSDSERHSEKSEGFLKQTRFRNYSASHRKPSDVDFDKTVLIHPEYPQIMTKPRPRVPGPITISSEKGKPTNAHSRPNIRFSLPIDATGEEANSKTQTERPPSNLVFAKPNEESPSPSYQGNFSGTKDGNVEGTREDPGAGKGKSRVPSQNMMPPPLNSNNKDQKEKDGLRPPPLPSDVVGMSPPPVHITTTHRPKETDFPPVSPSEAGLRPPPLYIPLNEESVTESPSPNVNMIPPKPRPTIVRPFLADILSQVRE